MTRTHKSKGCGAFSGRFAALLGCLAFTGGLEAQNYDNPSLGEQPVVVHPQDYKPLGIRAGGFMLHPGVQLAAEFNDNVFYTSEDELDDTVWHFRPYITAQSNWSRHAFNLRLAADVARHQDWDYRDYEDYFLLMQGRVDVRSRSYLTYSLDFMQLHEGLNNRAAKQGREPTIYDLYGGSLGYDHMFNRLSVGVLLNLRTLDYENTVDFDGTVIDNQDRNRDEWDATLRMGYQFQTDKQAFLSFAMHDVAYDQPLDRNDIGRDSDGWSANAGLAFNITGKLNGDVYATYHDRSYADPGLPGISGWGLGAGLQWMPTKLTSVGFRVASDVQPTTSQYSSGYLRRLYSVRVNHELLRGLQISGQVSYSDSDYELTADAPADSREQDELWQAGIGLTWFVNRWMFLSASYTHDRLTSNVPGDEYEVNRIWLTLSLER
jgi:hypothetical protein